MKLAEALIERKDLAARIAQLQLRVGQNATVSEGEKPTDDPISLFEEMGKLVEQQGVLIKRINKTNNTALVENGDTISEAIVNRDMLKLRMTQIENAIAQSQVRNTRYNRDDIKTIAVMDVKELRKGLDQFSKEYRVLDTLIQAANWGSDLLD